MSKKVEKGNAVGKGVAVVASLAAIAGAYFVYGTKEGSKAKKKIKSWSLKAKADVLEKLEKMKDVTEDSYQNTVSTVMQKYDKFRAQHGDEIDAVTKELKGYWNHMKKQLAPKTSKKKTTKKKS